MEKTDVLTKLDDEILALVEEDQMDTEVEQADEVRGKINLAIIGINDALEIIDEKSRSDKGGSSRRKARRRAETRSSNSSGRITPAHVRQPC